MKNFTVENLIKYFNFEVINIASDVKNKTISTCEANRPGLQLAGFYEKFLPSRLQVIGNAEWQYLSDLCPEDRKNKLIKFVTQPIPAIVMTSGNDIFAELHEAVSEFDVTLLRTADSTSKFINEFYNYASKKLAPKKSVHGVLIEVYGLGVLLMGSSGIGKSETALDLVTRGHRLVSDDVVELTRVNRTIEGESPELTRHFMEIRGVGILDIERLYGVGSVKQSQELDLVIELEGWESGKTYDRLGFEETYTEVLGVNIPTITIPMKPGRNIAMIIEVATRNLIQKKLGYNAAIELNKRVLEKIKVRKQMSK